MMQLLTEEYNEPEATNPFIDEIRKGMRANPDFGCCVFKKCCKKYKRGKRCKKCPDR